MFASGQVGQVKDGDRARPEVVFCVQSAPEGKPGNTLAHEPPIVKTVEFVDEAANETDPDFQAVEGPVVSNVLRIVMVKAPPKPCLACVPPLEAKQEFSIVTEAL
jgi:hypothetical protein